MIEKEKEAEVLVGVRTPVSLKDKAFKAAKVLDTDLSKELRRAMRELVARAEAMERAA